MSPYSFVHKINLMLSPVRKCKFFDINKNKAFFVFHGRLFLCAFISMVSPCSRESGILRDGQTNKKKKIQSISNISFWTVFKTVPVSLKEKLINNGSNKTPMLYKTYLVFFSNFILTRTIKIGLRKIKKKKQSSILWAICPCFNLLHS